MGEAGRPGKTQSVPKTATRQQTHKQGDKVRHIRQMFAPMKKGTVRVIVCDAEGNVMAQEGRLCERYASSIVGSLLVHDSDKTRREKK